MVYKWKIPIQHGLLGGTPISENPHLIFDTHQATLPLPTKLFCLEVWDENFNLPKVGSGAVEWGLEESGCILL